MADPRSTYLAVAGAGGARHPRGAGRRPSRRLEVAVVNDERRAEITVDLNYVNKITKELGAVLDDCDDDLLRCYALLVLTLGRSVTEEDVHDAWSVWRTATRPAHASLVPFDELTPEVQGAGEDNPEDALIERDEVRAFDDLVAWGQEHPTEPMPDGRAP